MLEYEICSPLPSNKIAQLNLQHCTKLHNELQNLLHNKIYLKIDFSLCFGFVKQTKKNRLHPQLNISRETPLTWLT